MLKPSCSYTFNKEDLAFVLELAKVGHVHLLSSQVTLTSYGDSNRFGFTFKEFGNEVECIGLKMPDNWCIEGIYCREYQMAITFGVEKSKAK
jgi:hypothetical protein